LRWNWLLNDDAGSTTAVDSYGGMNGTYMNGPTLNGHYATFNGTDQWVKLTEDSVNNFYHPAYETARTFSAWIKLDDVEKTQTILGATVPSGGNGWMFYHMNDGKFRFTRSGSAVYLSTASNGLEDGVWAHVAYTLNNTLKFYVNGEQVGDDVASYNSYNNNETSTVGLASDGGGASSFLDGSMADVRYIIQSYGATNPTGGDGALTQEQLQAIYAIKPIDPASATVTSVASPIADGDTIAIANAAEVESKIRDDLKIVSVAKGGPDGARFSATGDIAAGQVAAGESVSAWVTFDDASNLLNGYTATASYDVTVGRTTMPGYLVNTVVAGPNTAAEELNYTLSATVSGNTSALGTAQTATSVTDLSGLESHTARGTGGALGTSAELLDGTADSAGLVSQTWRLRSGSGAEAADKVYSDVIDLTTPTGTNPFVLQLSYSEADLSGMAEGDLLLGWLDTESGDFVNAIMGNADGGAFQSFVAGAWSESYATAGYYGVDTTDNKVWAVIDHNSEFAVIPEPNTIGLLLLMGAVTFFRKLRTR
jgi:hypothetical protein